MKKNFIMESADALQRVPTKVNRTTISENLRSSLHRAAIERATNFYTEFFNLQCPETTNELESSYREVIKEAKSLSLLARFGGISAKDHLNLWCMGKVLQPEQYVESGVFIGSSLHALLNSTSIDSVTAIDPNLSKLRVNTTSLKNVDLIDDRDFSEINFPAVSQRHLVFFDDHINAAKRIISAHNKGFRYLLFDDATGFEGICQRLYPAIPSIPMILNPTLLSDGDHLSWSFTPRRNPGLKNFIKQFLQGSRSGQRVTLKITGELIEQCKEAGSLILNAMKLPELGEFIYQDWPERTADTTKYLVELKD